jgi:SAM-dependent methyltransferase
MGDTVDAQGADLPAWFATPAGRYLLGWEQARFDQAVVDLFGYNALQLGLPELKTLAANRMPHRWLSVPETGPQPCGASLVTHAAALPFQAQSLDLLTLPHTLELSADPHAVLREVERVLVPEGRVVVSGLNPTSLWGWRQQRAHWCRRVGWTSGPGQLFLPEAGDFIGHWRLRDWLRLLGFEVEVLQLGCYKPAVRSEVWLQRFDWMDRYGPRWWSVLGAVYFVVAVKRVRGMRLLGPAWKPRRVAAAPVAVVQRPSVGAMHGDSSA